MSDGPASGEPEDPGGHLRNLYTLLLETVKVMDTLNERIRKLERRMNMN